MSLITTKLLSLVFLPKFSFGYYDGRNFILLKEQSKSIHLLGSIYFTQKCIDLTSFPKLHSRNHMHVITITKITVSLESGIWDKSLLLQILLWPWASSSHFFLFLFFSFCFSIWNVDSMPFMFQDLTFTLTFLSTSMLI